MPHLRHRLAATALFAALAQAQVPPGGAPPVDASALDAVPAPGSPAEVRWQAGREALGAGRLAEAVPHLLAALEFHPASPPVLLDLVRAVEDAGAKALWLDRYVRAAADVQGKLKLDAATRKLLGAEPKAEAKLAELRAQAAAELAKLIERMRPGGKDALGSGAVARWAAELLVELAAGSPALLRGHGVATAQALARHAADWDTIGKALLQVAQQKAPPPAGDPDLARRAARVLAGLARQAAFGKDLQSDAPAGIGELAAQAAAATANLAPKAGPPRVYSIDELLAMDAAARDAFTLAHRDPGQPGVALSPNGRYRIETVCGHTTLLAAAQTVELHHARLAHHYGADPFGDRQGLVVIVPEVHDLEAEGAPFWWAGGFQGGDRTVIRFAWDNVPGMGRTLTHELTHRFDGVLRPFLPSWYGEGHAQWTAAHYAKMADPQCLEDFLDTHTVASVYGLGYGGLGKFTQLLKGELEDYRDNYPVGYSLYAFLRGHPPKSPPKYRARLELYERNARSGGKDPVGYFTATFCDGKDGRPADLPGFVAEWDAFLCGCARWPDEKVRRPEDAWVPRYGDRGAGDEGGMVYDEPTWSWGRHRAEPFFGQGHAAAAGEVLQQAGLPGPAAAAFLASLACEGFTVRAAAPAVARLHEAGRKEAAAALRELLLARHPGSVPPADGPVPMLAQLPKTKALLDALASAAAGHAAAGRDLAAAALQTEQARLAARCALPAAAPVAGALLPPPPPPRALGGFGWAEDRLTGYDKDRARGAWFTTPTGDLHVGRDQPRETTGGPDRTAHARPVFVRAVEWLLPGHYSVRTRVHFTTAYVSGAIVLGHWRRDRNVRLHFHAGDFAFATGERQVERNRGKVSFGMSGLWERDDKLPQALPGGDHELRQPASFELELRVRGPSVLVLVDGEPLGRYTSHDGAPLEGHLGFAMSRGAIRVQAPVVQRLDAAEPGLDRAAVAAVGLDLATPPKVALDDLLHLRTRGIPTSPVGTLVLLLPKPEERFAADEYSIDRAVPVLAKLLQDTVEFPQPWHLAVPAGSTPAQRKQVLERLAEFRKEPPPVLEHQLGPPFTGAPWVLFVDHTGVLRAAAEVGEVGLHSRVQRWARLFRAR